ncbi:polysaccharide lyase [soil metagenome]
MTYLRSAVSADLLPFATIEIPAIENIRQGSDGRGAHLELRTFKGQTLKNGGVRAEISIDYPFREGETLRYSWRMMLPRDFASDAPANRWWIVAQWHDQPDRSKGQTWDGFPGHSPSVGLGYGQIEGQDSLSLLYGAPDPLPGGLIPISRGVWHDISVEIIWSLGPSGRVKVFMDGGKTPVREASGRNMYNAFQHYMKLGMYRHPDIRGDAWIYISDVSIQRLPGT